MSCRRFIDGASSFGHVEPLISSRTTAGTVGNQFRKLCRREFINYLVREWQDLVRQLRQITREVLKPQLNKIKLSTIMTVSPGAFNRIVSHWSGMSAAKFSRGSHCCLPRLRSVQKRHDFVWRRAGGSLGLWARQVAAIEPAWIEHAAGSLAKVHIGRIVQRSTAVDG